MWAAVDGNAACSGGETGVPLLDVVVEDFSFADEDGTGNQLCPGVGFAGSSGGAFRLFLGIEETGCACKTSFWTG